MRITQSVAAALAALTALVSPAAAQARRERPTLVFTVSGAYRDGVSLWTVPDQPVEDNSGVTLTDHFFLNRSVRRSLGAGFSGTYYKGAHFGLSAEAFLVGLGYDDTCRLVAPAQSTLNEQRCNSIDRLERSAAAVTLSAGGVYRVGSDEFISPFARAHVGVLVNNQSPLLLVGETANGAELVIYDDPNTGTRLRPALLLGVGATVAAGRGYQLRWEIRDNILGIQRVTGVVGRGLIPPHETAYKHIFSLNVGLDVILERRPGRRY
jgi:opacity protein-like surface antigen